MGVFFFATFNLHFYIFLSRNPTPQQVLGIHFDLARNGELKYLNLNTTFNSSILLNYRQTETAFWTQVRIEGRKYFRILVYIKKNLYFSIFQLLLVSWCQRIHHQQSFGGSRVNRFK